MIDFLKLFGLGIIGIVVAAIAVGLFAGFIYLLTNISLLAYIFWALLSVFLIMLIGGYVKKEFFPKW